jgi:hypothetical protein
MLRQREYNRIDFISGQFDNFGFHLVALNSFKPKEDTAKIASTDS